ncbi:MAG: hypothetical protein OIF32_07165, partial [Campylobacterales bacterium]|nr:hypothetical protein [Campylobacterales bacterium]
MNIKNISMFIASALVISLTGCSADIEEQKANQNTNEESPISLDTVQQSPGIEVSKIRGNTASYDSVAQFSVSLKSKPSDSVTIPLSSSNTNEGALEISKMIFTPENWDKPQTVAVKGRNKNVANGKQDYKILLKSTT